MRTGIGVGHVFKFGLLSACVLACFALRADDANQPPAVTSPAAASPNPASVGGSVKFTVSATDPDGDALTTSWNYGDGQSDSTGMHTYASAGTYNAAATISDGRGGSVTSSLSLIVNSGFVISSPVAAYPNVAGVGQEVVFTIGASSPNAPLKVVWNYGDGMSDTIERHAYAAAGPYAVTATVTDGAGNTANSSAVVLVSDAPPAINVPLQAWPGTAAVGQQVLFTIDAFDPDGDPTVIAWDYGDGTTGNVETHTYSAPGTFIAAAVISDEHGGLAVSTTTVTVTGSGAGAGPNPTAPLPQTQVAPTTNPSSDPLIAAPVRAWPNTASPGDTVLFTIGAAASDGGPVSITWDYGDGSSGTVENHAYAQGGSFPVVATVTDDQRHTAISSTVVLIADAPPVVYAPIQAWPGTVGINQKVLFTINASDPDGDPVVVKWYYGDGSTGNVEQHEYATPGVYTPVAIVSDNKGGMAISATTVTVTTDKAAINKARRQPRPRQPKRRK